MLELSLHRVPFYQSSSGSQVTVLRVQPPSLLGACMAKHGHSLSTLASTQRSESETSYDCREAKYIESITAAAVLGSSSKLPGSCR